MSAGLEVRAEGIDASAPDGIDASAPDGIDAGAPGGGGAAVSDDLLDGLFGPDVRGAASGLEADPEDLPPDERALVARAVDSRRREFATGRVLARRLLGDLGLDAGPLLRDADRVPRWPAEAVGCIAHTHDLCAVVVAPAAAVAGLGLDVEGDAPLDARLRARICTPAERRWLAGHDPAAADRLGKAFFCVKESVYKACFPRLRERWGFGDLEVALDPRAGAFEAEPAHGALAGRRLTGRVERRGRWWIAACTLGFGALP